MDDCSTGYPNVGAFLDSDESYTIYRQFGYLQSRLLLEKQDELRLLEEKLDEMDKEDDLDDESRRRLKTRDLQPEYAAERKEIFGAIEKKFLEYGKSFNVAKLPANSRAFNNGGRKFIDNCTTNSRVQSPFQCRLEKR